MEGGLDVEAHAAQEEEPKQTSGTVETEEGNKFQKAIGAWRSMSVYLPVHLEMLTRSRYRLDRTRPTTRHGSLRPRCTPKGYSHSEEGAGAEDQGFQEAG